MKVIQLTKLTRSGANGQRIFNKPAPWKKMRTTIMMSSLLVFLCFNVNILFILINSFVNININAKLIRRNYIIIKDVWVFLTGTPNI